MLGGKGQSMKLAFGTKPSASSSSKRVEEHVTWIERLFIAYFPSFRAERAGDGGEATGAGKAERI